MSEQWLLELPEGFTLTPFDLGITGIQSFRISSTEAHLGGLSCSEAVSVSRVVVPDPDPTPNPTPTPVLVVYEVVAETGLKVRSTPQIPTDNPNGNKIGLIMRGKRFSIDSAATAPLANGYVWAKIESTEHMGAWVALRSVDGNTVLAKKVETGG